MSDRLPMEYENDNLIRLLRASEHGIDALTLALSDALGYSVIVSAHDGEVVSSTLVDADAGSFSVGKTMPPLDDGCFQSTLSFPHSKKEALGWSICFEGRTLGHCFVVYGEDAPEPAEFGGVVGVALSLLTTHLQRIAEVRREKRRMKDAFFYDLLYGNIKKSEEVVSMGELWGWDFRLPHAVCVLAGPEADPLSSGDRLLDAANKALSRRLAPGCGAAPATTVFQNMLVAVIPAPAPKRTERRLAIEGLLQDCLLSVSEEADAHLLKCGVGQVYREPNDLFRSYQEAKVALEIGLLQGRRLAFFGEMGLDRILYKHDVEDLREYLYYVLGPLLDLEDDKEDLIGILECFVENEFSVNATSASTFLHRNTLRYKLAKIESMLDRSFADMDTRLDLVAAFKIRRLHGFDDEG